MTIEKIVEILELGEEDIENIKISDKVENLVLVHHERHINPTIPETKVSSIRGVVIDLENEKILTPGFSNTRKAIVSPESIANSETAILKNEFSITDEYGVEHIIDLKNKKTQIIPFSSGFGVQVFKHNGVIYTSMRTSIRPFKTKRKRGKKGYKTFEEMWVESGNIDVESLFPEDVKDSPYVYLFYVTHNQLLQENKIPIFEGGFITLSNIYNMWDYDDDYTDIVHEEPVEFDSINILPKTYDGFEIPFIFDPEPLNKADAFNFLLYGFGNKLIRGRLGQGESVLLIKDDDTSITGTTVIHLMSDAYSYRESLIKGSSNLYAAYVTRLSNINVFNEPEEFLDIFPNVKVPNDAMIQIKEFLENFDKMGSNTFLKTEEQTIEDLQNYRLIGSETYSINDRFEFTNNNEEEYGVGKGYNMWVKKAKHIWWLYCLSIAPVKLAEISTFYDRLLKDRENVVVYISGLVITNIHETRIDIPGGKSWNRQKNRIFQIFNSISKYNRRIKNNNLLTHRVKNSVNYFINNEFSHSLNGLINYVNVNKLY